MHYVTDDPSTAATRFHVLGWLLTNNGNEYV
jgi:hypothetical protein